MFQKNALSVSFMLLSFIISMIVSQIDSFAQQKIRIGIYDSRAIALAYFNSGYAKKMQDIVMKLQLENAKALEAKDSLKSKKLIREGQLRQAILHEQGFGTGSVKECLAAIKDKVQKFAQSEKIDLIVSKWELNYSSSQFEIVDITEQLANLFEPNKRFKDTLKDLLKSEPIKDAYLIED